MSSYSDDPPIQIEPSKPELPWGFDSLQSITAIRILDGTASPVELLSSGIYSFQIDSKDFDKWIDIDCAVKTEASPTAPTISIRFGLSEPNEPPIWQNEVHLVAERAGDPPKGTFFHGGLLRVPVVSSLQVLHTKVQIYDTITGTSADQIRVCGRTISFNPHPLWDPTIERVEQRVIKPRGA
ncbi:MAG: hypothetical protein MUC92_05790 [Fimbriimonadaceae bacterium]|nr:hypothetical protein [Fimbriimonadaceae bacterium]